MDFLSDSTGIAALLVSASTLIYTRRRNKKLDEVQAKAIADEAERAAAALSAEKADRLKAQAAADTEAARREKEVATLLREAQQRDKQLDLLSTRVELALRQANREAKAQASQVCVTNSSTASIPDGIVVERWDELWTVLVENQSGRPITDLQAGVRPVNAVEKYMQAHTCIGPGRKGGSTSTMSRDYRLSALNGGYWCTFVFDVTTKSVPQPDIAVRFVDDEGNAWQTGDGRQITPVVVDDWR